MKQFLIFVLIAITLITSAFADEMFDEQGEALEIDELYNDEFEIEENISLDEGLKKLGSRLRDEFQDVFSRALSCIGIVIAVSVLAAIITGMHENGLDKTPNYINTAAALAICSAAVGSASSYISLAVESIDSMHSFSRTLLTTLAASVAACGSPLGAVARYTASVTFSEIAIAIISSLLIPLIYTYIAAATATAAIPGATTGKIADFIKWSISGILKIILTAFVGYITVSGFVASTGDIAGLKTASAISGAVPVVGGILSNAAGAVLAGAKIMKNSIGVFGMLSVISICLTPCLVLSVNYLLFKASAAVIAPLCDTRICELVERIGSSFGVMLGICASCAFLLFMAILSCMLVAGVS